MKNTILSYNENSITVTTITPKKIVDSIDYTHKALCEEHPLLTTNQKKGLKSNITDLIFKLIADAHENTSIRHKIEVPSDIYGKFNYSYNYKPTKKNYIITYTQMVKILASEECAFLIRSKSYCAGKFPMFVHLNRWCTEEETSENQMLSTRTIESKPFKIDKKILSKHPKLIKNFDLVKIDIDGYLEFLNENQEIKYEVSNKNVVLKQNLSTLNKLNLVINYILRNYYATESEKTGRLYTSFSGLPSDLMPFLTDKKTGKKLIERDAANFGPAVIGMLTGNKYVIEAASQGKFYDNIGEVIYLDYHKRIEEGTPDENNTTFYNNIVKLSKNILKNTGKPLIVDEEFTRNFAKLQSFGSLLYVKTPYKTGRFANIINEVYPGLIEDIENLQKELKEKNGPCDTLAAKVQSIEAKIFVKPFLKTKKFYLTKHDSIFFLEKDIEYFENKLKENLEKQGVKTKLK